MLAKVITVKSLSVLLYIQAKFGKRYRTLEVNIIFQIILLTLQH